MNKRLELLVATGPIAGKRFAVGSGGSRLGRSSSNNIKIPDEELSRNHCLVEPSGETGLRLIDLASANGTFVNGEQVGAEPVELKAGDDITLGSTRIRVVGEGEAEPKASVPAATAPATAEIDLGLGGDDKKAAAADAANGTARTEKSKGRKRNPAIYFLWAFALAVLGLAGWLLLQNPAEPPPAATPGDLPAGEEKVRGKVVEMSYEKVSADSKGIFRYKMDLTPDGTLKVAVDDVPGANRHIVKSASLSAEALARIADIFADPEFQSLDKDYVGPTEDPPKLESCEVKVVFSHRVKIVRVVNTTEPDVFRRLREKLETFSKNELGIWAIQYSSDKLVELAEASARNAQTKWEDRDVQYGNIHAAIAAWREAMFYLETVNPKPAAFETYRTAKEEAEKELERRFSDQRFRADRAINLADWQTAAAELKILCEMVPDRNDARAREAADKLLDVEKRVKKGGSK